MASDRRLASFRRDRPGSRHRRRHEAARERCGRRISARLCAHGRARRVAAHAGVRLRPQRAADGRAGPVSSGRGRRQATDAEGAGQHTGRLRLAGSPRRSRRRRRQALRRVRIVSELGPGRRSGPSRGDDRGIGRHHGERRTRPGRDERPAPGRAVLDPGHADHPALRVRRRRGGSRAGPARPDRRRGDVRPPRAHQPGLPARRQREDGRPPDRHGRGRRLRALLRDPLPRGTSSRPLLARSARADGPDLRAHGPHLGHHGCDRDGRHVRARPRHLQRHRERDDHGHRVRGRRLRHRPARGARAARRPDRQGPDSVPAAPGDRQPELPLLAGRRRPRAAASTPLLRRLRRIARRACAPGSAAARGQAGRRGSRLTQRAGSRDAGQDPDELPERRGHGDRRRRRAPRLGAESEGCDGRARTARARRRHRAPAVHRQWKRPPAADRSSFR